MKTLFVICPSPTDGTSLYRGMGPLSHLKRSAKSWDEGLNIITADNANWAILAGVDAVFMQRPFTDAHVRLAKLCASNGKQLWIDYDDNLFTVPTDNPTFRNYSKESNQKNVAMLLAMADQVSVSTKILARDFDPIRTKARKSPCEVIPNALNEKMFKPRERSLQRNQLVMWRGSNTHDRDLMEFKEQIKLNALGHEKTTFTFIGDPFWVFMEGLPKNCMQADPVDPIEYFQVIDRIRPLMAFVPLHDSHFNRCKSNIAWIEASYAGAACLVPEWEEWSLPGAITYKDKSEFYEKMFDMIEDPDMCRKHAEESWKYIQANLTLEKVNQSRRNILDRMFAQD